MKKEIICERCRISKGFYELMPKNCFDKEGNWHKKHQWIKEKVCICGHGETSHYERHGLVQCSIGYCFPFRSEGHLFKV